MTDKIHNYLIDYYRKARLASNKKTIHKESIVRQTYQKKTQQVEHMSSIDDFLRNQKQIAAQPEPLEFRCLPRRLKVYFPGPPNPPPPLTQIPYTYQIVPQVPFKLPKQKPGYVGDWVLQESYFPNPTHQSVIQQNTSKQKYHHQDFGERSRRFRSEVKRIAKVMKQQNLSFKEIIKNKGFIKKSHNYYNSYEFFETVKKGDKSFQSMVELNPYLAFDVDDQKMTALHWASRQGHVYIVKVLLQKFRANPLAKDIYGRTPLHLAVMNKKSECIIRIFIEGGQLNSINNDKKSVRMVAEDSYTKYLLEKLEESRFLIKTKGIKDIKLYREQLQRLIKTTLDESSLYF